MRILMLVWACLWLNPRGAAAVEIDPHEAPATLQSAAVRFIESELRHRYSKTRVDLSAMDPRLKLNRCQSELDLFLPPGQPAAGPVSVGVRCREPTPWLIYMRAYVTAFGPAVVTRRPLQKGTVIAAPDIELKEMELTRIHQQIFSKPADVLGKELTRSLAAGHVLTAPKLKNPKAVKRGEEVIIFAQKEGMQIRMKGSALADGVTGQRITVRNLSSDRIVQGTVTGPGIVQIQF